LKITILQGAFFPVPPVLGGAVEKVWYRMGQEFALLGHEVIHIGCTHPQLPDAEYSNGVNYIRIPGYDAPSKLIKLKWLDLLYSIRAIKKIPECDVIVTNSFWSPILLRDRRGKKVYIDVQRVPRGQMKFYRHVGMLRGCSPAICAAIKAELPANSHSLVSYVPNPVPFTVKPLFIKKEKIILFVGRLHPEKGVHILLKAFSILAEEIRTNWKLIIVGSSDFKDGGGGDLYLTQLKELANGVNIEFTGPIYNEQELISYYARAGIFCYPAQDGSGDAAPVAPREAMAYGCVPVVSELECFDDFIVNGINGLKFNQITDGQPKSLAEKLSSLVNNNLMLEKMSQECKLVYEKFSPSTVAKAFIKDFEKIKRGLKVNESL
jgi:glycosyltransferase involved in cell wall biosynthesis